MIRIVTIPPLLLIDHQCSGIFCVGMNYVDHCTEQNFPIPDEPIIFNKLPRCIRGPDDDLLHNPIVPNLDFEVELAIVIGKRCRYVSEEEAPGVIAGYTVAHDVSARHWQLKRNGGQWVSDCFVAVFCTLLFCSC